MKKFNVSFVIEAEDVSNKDVQEYVHHAVRSWGGQFDPEHPFFGENKTVTKPQVIQQRPKKRKPRLPRGWTKGKVKQARDDLASLHDPRSLSYNDGYYANSLVSKYGMSVSELEKIVGRPVFSGKPTWE